MHMYLLFYGQTESRVIKWCNCPMVGEHNPQPGGYMQISMPSVWLQLSGHLHTVLVCVLMFQRVTAIERQNNRVISHQLLCPFPAHKYLGRVAKPLMGISRKIHVSAL